MATANSGGTAVLTLRSKAFRQGELIPQKYTCEGDNINPPVEISGMPEGTATLALIVEDPDAPKGVFDHWVVWNIPPEKAAVAENSIPGISGHNGYRKTGYAGPCPPSGSHHYHFKAYALDTGLDLPAGSAKQALLEAMEGHVLASGELVGIYRKTKAD